jgi:acetyl esterase/lipase
VVGQLQRGYAVASIEYRLSPEAKWPAQIFDCKAAVRFLRANAKRYNLDPGRFGVWGDSAGGHLAAMVGVSGGVKELEGDLGNPGVSSSVQAVCDWYGPTDLTVIQKTPNNAVGPVSQLIGGPIAENLEKARTASPINYVTRNTPAFLIMHGDQDETVPINQSELLNEALQKAGAWVKFVRVQGAKHGGPDFAGFNNPTILTMIEQFFDEHLQAPG